MNASASASVIVLNDGVPMGNAIVEARGNGIVRRSTTNAAGGAIFSGLSPGHYIFNAAKGATYFGNGQLTLGAGDSKALYIRYPQVSSRGRLTVRVFWRGQAGQVSVESGLVRVSGPGGNSQLQLSNGRATFRGLAAGQYSVGASGMYGGVLAFGSGSVRVPTGGEATLSIVLSKPLDNQNAIDLLRKERNELIDRHQKLEQKATQLKKNVRAAAKQSEADRSDNDYKDGAPGAKLGKAVLDSMREAELARTQVERDMVAERLRQNQKKIEDLQNEDPRAR